MLKIFLALAFAASSVSATSPQMATVTAFSGIVELLTHPSRELKENEKLPHARFEGQYYLYREARLGDRVENGTFVRVRVGSKAQLTFDNGDQISLASGTLFRSRWSQDAPSADQAAPQMDLPYGKVHALISKTGPRSRLKLRSGAMVLGVRGTEFTAQPDRMSVLRGEVQLQVAAQPPVAVKENQTAQVAATKTAAPVQIARTTREELQEIRELARPPEMEAKEKPPEVIALEKKATQVAIQDIKEYHPEWAKDLSADETSGEIRERILERMQAQAPSRKSASDIEREAYEKIAHPAPK